MPSLFFIKLFCLVHAEVTFFYGSYCSIQKSYDEKTSYKKYYCS